MGTIAVAIAFVGAPAAAQAEYFVPPSNSAATQYTEAVPTAGGHRDSEKGRRGNRSAADVLGERKAQRLNEQGPDGQEVAEVVAETAPGETVEVSLPGGNGGNRNSDPPPAEREREQQKETGMASTGTGGSGNGDPGPSGSSGLGEVLAQATGVSSSGQLGLLLPLTIAAIAAWALAFLLRQRNRPTS